MVCNHPNDIKKTLMFMSIHNAIDQREIPCQLLCNEERMAVRQSKVKIKRNKPTYFPISFWFKEAKISFSFNTIASVGRWNPKAIFDFDWRCCTCRLPLCVIFPDVHDVRMLPSVRIALNPDHWQGILPQCLMIFNMGFSIDDIFLSIFFLGRITMINDHWQTLPQSLLPN